jgi:D-tyrosyl-tRNA(Tyr) deacylase
MRLLIQRVTSAAVAVDGRQVAAITRGLLVLAGVAVGDTAEDVTWLAGKTARMRIFPDDRGLMNRSVIDAGGDILVISQFTLLADAASGNRPSFTGAARPAEAVPLLDSFIAAVGGLLGRPVPTGVFGADMQVSLVNDGPVTIWLDSRQRG